MKKTYTVKVDNESVEVEAYGVYDAATNAMLRLKKRAADKVRVISGQGEHRFYYVAKLDGNDVLLYERKG